LVAALDRGLEFGMRRDAARLREDLAALDLVALDAAKERPDVVAGLALVKGLAEHLDAGDHDLAGGGHPAQLDLVADLDDAALDPARRHRAPALDPEHVLDG